MPNPSRSGLAPPPSWATPSTLLSVPDTMSGPLFMCRQDLLLHLDQQGQERSPLGARIRINPNLPLPLRFALELTPGGFVYAKVAWRRDDRAGVKLDLPLQSPGFIRRM